METTIFNSILDLVKVFKDEKTCHQYLAQQRWEGEIKCPYENCNGQGAYVFKDGIRYKCTCCKKIYTAKTRTFMEGSKLPTIKWILAIYLIMHKNGISSVQLSKDIGVTQKTSWFLLQRIRTAFGNLKNDSELTGVVMADETFVGGKNKNRHFNKKVKQSQGRSFKDKTPVLGLMEANDRQVKCFVVKDTSTYSIQPIVKDNVCTGSIFVSDEWHGYKGLDSIYEHYIVDHSRKEYLGNHGYSTNALEGFWAISKRSVHGTYIKLSRKHMQRYFDEFSFRYNLRNLPINSQISIFVYKCLEGRLKYKDLTA